jgi:hypothetical protein
LAVSFSCSITDSLLLLISIAFDIRTREGNKKEINVISRENTIILMMPSLINLMVVV